MTFFNDEITALKYLVEEQLLPINDTTVEIPPLRLAIKYESWNVIEYLVKNGAYYFGQNKHRNNFKEDLQDKRKYVDLKTGKQIK